MKDALSIAVRRSFDRLLRYDGVLFDCPIEEDDSDKGRKLHEVCLNHRLANHLQDEVLPMLGDEAKMFVDIEFNKEGVNNKIVNINGVDKPVRPDIIIHNRRTGQEKKNFLVVECKKKGANRADIQEDKDRILAMMNDEIYEYLFGLQVIYGKEGVSGVLFFRVGTDIHPEDIVSSLN